MKSELKELALFSVNLNEYEICSPDRHKQRQIQKVEGEKEKREMAKNFDLPVHCSSSVLELM